MVVSVALILIVLPLPTPETFCPALLKALASCQMLQLQVAVKDLEFMTVRDARSGIQRNHD
jgi:hypothetical protein